MAGDGSSFDRPSRDHSSQRGSGSKSFRGGRGRGRGGGSNRGKKRDLGRSEWSKQKPDKRAANNEAQAAKKQKLNSGEAAPLPVYATQFDAEDIAAEERRPKKKVAVLLGYSGTGYKGMQLAPDQKTIEGDLFKAFVGAGAISKANADDPKKSSFVRCARTDKGVHAAGNIISLKLIVEDENIVQKINDNLTPQIRVWGFERTNNSFSSYQLCDSRIYEYLIPTHSFLPPHPKSFLGRKCKEWAEKTGDLEQWEKRQEEVKGYWEAVDDDMIKPILKEYPEDVRDVLQKALWLTAEQEANKQSEAGTKTANPRPTEQGETSRDESRSKDAAEETLDPEKVQAANAEVGEVQAKVEQNSDGQVDTTQGQITTERVEPAETNTRQVGEDSKSDAATAGTAETPDARSLMTKEERIARRKLIDDGVKKLRAAYVAAKRRYRIPDSRKQRLQDVLDLYLGTRNFWNFTVQKSFKDPSAKRVIKSFKVNFDPILIDGTEWLSLKVHGQSFMMHQIRKMVGMASLIVRCGCDPKRLTEAYGPANFSIPKAPALGLLLERPVFDSYNKRAKSELGKEAIDFDKFKTEMDAFKQKFIYERMYEDEERENIFGNFFNHVDNFPSNTFLFVTSGGLDASGEADGPETGAAIKDGGTNGEHGVSIVDLDSDEEAVAFRDNAGDEG